MASQSVLAVKNGQEVCWYCGTPLRGKQGIVFFSLDHKIPKCRGGGNEPANLVKCCVECNSDKGNLTFEEYRVIVSFRRQQLKPRKKQLVRFEGEKLMKGKNG